MNTIKQKICVFLMLGFMFALLLSGAISAEGPYYATKDEAILNVPTYIVPKSCFVWKDGPDPAMPWRVIPGYGCAHWVAHEMCLQIDSPWQRWERGEIEPPLPPESWQVCYDGYYIRVQDVIAGRNEVEIKDAKVGDIWTNDDLSHTGIVRQVGDNKVYVEHCSNVEGGVVQNWFSSGKCWQLKHGLDLIFTIDTTGSMWDDIAAVKTSATDIINQIDVNIPDYRIAVVDYKDFPVSPYGGPSDYPYNDALAFSTDKSTIIAAIQGLSASGGADWRESVYSALMHAIDATSLGGWRGEEHAAKIIILMCDAPPHDPEPFTDYTLSDVVTAAENADPVHIYPIQIGGTVEKMQELADQTGGSVFTAENAGEVVDAILDAIEEIKSKPVADANGPYEGFVNIPITFDGTGSYDLDGVIVSYEWDLDDDGEFDDAFGPTPTATWSTSYVGNISLKVTDNDGYIDVDTTTLNLSSLIVSATIDIDPDTLNLKSKGKWITCYIELPDSYDVADIDISTILLNNVVPAEDHPTDIGDYDNDGVYDLMVKFDRQDVIDILEAGDNVEITVAGELIDGTLFEGTDYIRVI